jgi:hypothetical protein
MQILSLRKSKSMKQTLSLLAFVATLSFAPVAVGREAAAMVQMTNYDGKEAYLAVYLVNPSGRYQQTLWVSGRERIYYSYLSRWWRYLARAPQELDAITGASAGAGDRVSLKFDLKDEWINSGYAIRVESAVEGGGVNSQDALYELKSENSGGRVTGVGYVRNLRIRW